MRLIDENGFLFGKINVVDLLVVLGLFTAVGVGVGSLVAADSDGPAGPTQQIVVETEPLPEFVVDSIETGPVPTQSVVTVDEIREVRSVDNSTVLRLQVTVRVKYDDNRLPMFDRERLYIGRELSLDLGSTVVDGVVHELGPIVSEQ